MGAIRIFQKLAQLVDVLFTSPANGDVVTYNNSSSKWVNQQPVTTTLASPTGTIGLSSVAGSLTTAMRSDAAPALSQAIAPTWTGLHTFNGGLTGAINPTSTGATTPASGAFTSLQATSFFQLLIGANNKMLIGYFAPTLAVTSDYAIGWASSATSAAAALDVQLVRVAANTLGLRNSTNTQTLQVYGTSTDASNYRRASLNESAAGVLTLSSEGLGTGASGNTIIFGTNGGTRVTVSDTGMAVAATIKTGTYTVATLPSASTSGAGTRAWVTDSSATTFAATVSGGGSNKVPVASDGTNWIIG